GDEPHREEESGRDGDTARPPEELCQRFAGQQALRERAPVEQDAVEQQRRCDDDGAERRAEIGPELTPGDQQGTAHDARPSAGAALPARSSESLRNTSSSSLSWRLSAIRRKPALYIFAPTSSRTSLCACTEKLFTRSPASRGGSVRTLATPGTDPRSWTTCDT